MFNTAFLTSQKKNVRYMKKHRVILKQNIVISKDKMVLTPNPFYVRWRCSPHLPVRY